MKHLLTLCILVAFATDYANAVVIVNPPRPITHTVTVQPVIVSNDDGSNTANYLSDTGNEGLILGEIDQIWAQAGIDVEWLTPNTWNSTLANFGSAGNGTRPNDDLLSLPGLADAAGVSSPDPATINMYFMQVPPGTGPGGPSFARTRLLSGSTFIRLSDRPPFDRPLATGVSTVLSRAMAFSFGLNDNSEPDNLLGPLTGSNFSERLNDTQIAAALESGFVVVIPEPTTLALLGVATLALVSRRRPRLIQPS
ncbi:MAG: PEP-CTERM sorting domain-containing protein [Planctomycetota bacterium]